MKSRVSCYNALERSLRGKFRTYEYPENGLMPELQVAAAGNIVLTSAKSGVPFAVLATSPYVLKAIAVRCDLLEQEVEFLDPDGKPIEFEKLFKEFSDPFARLVHGDHWQGEAGRQKSAS